MSLTRLPNAHCAFVEESKIREYLLNPDHEQGGTKAKFFRERGFLLPDWEALSDALKQHGQERPVTRVTSDEYGTRYQVDCGMKTPKASEPCVRTVWQLVHDDDCPRLLTAHPLK